MSTEMHERITNEIAVSLELGNIPPWRCPWSMSGPPANATTGRRYTGINVWLLHLHRQRLGLSSNLYATFGQWRDIGCQVKARPSGVQSGRWGCNLVFCKSVKKKSKGMDEDEEPKGEYLLLRNFTVFSLDQVEGEYADRLRTEVVSEKKPLFAPVERAVAATGADIRHGGDRAFYRRPIPAGDGDFIQVPDKLRFAEERDYYATAFHELAHWSEVRLGWSGSYAEGELRAEMAACFALAELGFAPGDRKDSTAYLADWLKSMKEDARYIFRITAAASRAANYLLSFSCTQRAECEEPAVASSDVCGERLDPRPITTPAVCPRSICRSGSVYQPASPKLSNNCCVIFRPEPFAALRSRRARLLPSLSCV